MTKDNTEEIQKVKRYIENTKSYWPKEYWTKNTDIYCEILEHLISFTRKVDVDERIKDDSIKELSIIAFYRGFCTIAYLPEIDSFPAFTIIDNLSARLYTILYTDEKISSTEKWRMLKEHLNEEYKQYCHK